jgi:YggT family protein
VPLFGQIAQLLIQTAFGVFVYALLLRFYMQWLRAPFRNPVGQFVSALTDWIVKPARRVIPGLLGLDLATILIAWFAEALMLVLLYWLRGFSFAGAPGIAAGLLFTIAAVELVRSSLYLLIGVIIVQVIISWVNPHAPLAPVFDALTRPFYAVFRRLVPAIGNVDLSPLFVLLIAQILLLLLDNVARLVPGGG